MSITESLGCAAETNRALEVDYESECVNHSIASDSLETPMDYSPSGLLCRWNSPGKNTGWVATAFQGIFLDLGIEAGSPAFFSV